MNRLLRKSVNPPVPPPGNIRITRKRGLKRPSLMQWVAQHRAAVRNAVAHLLEHRLASLIHVWVIGIALALPLLLDHAVRNLARIGGALDEQRSVTVFLDPGLDAKAVEAAMSALRSVPGVATLRRRSPAQGLSDLRKLPGFDAAVAVLDRNPLPWVALITPRDVAVEELVGRLQRVPGVDLVQHDAAWRERLDRIVSLLRRIVLVLSVLLGLGAASLIANAIRLDVMARREEIAIVSLLGGSDAYVRRPFLYGGALYGVLGAMTAVALVWSVHLAIQGPVADLAMAYSAEFRLDPPNPGSSLLALAVGGGLGWIGALVAATLTLLTDRPR